MRFRIFHWIRIYIWFRTNLHRKKNRSSEFSLCCRLWIPLYKFGLIQRSMNPCITFLKTDRFGGPWISASQFLKNGPIRWSMNPCIQILKNGPIRWSMNPCISISKKRTDSAVHGSLLPYYFYNLHVGDCTRGNENDSSSLFRVDMTHFTFIILHLSFIWFPLEFIEVTWFIPYAMNIWPSHVKNSFDSRTPSGVLYF